MSIGTLPVVYGIVTGVAGADWSDDNTDGGLGYHWIDRSDPASFPMLSG
jgi:hypothetical protein